MAHDLSRERTEGREKTEEKSVRTTRWMSARSDQTHLFLIKAEDLERFKAGSSRQGDYREEWERVRRER